MDHHGLIKMLVEEALHTFTILIAWEIFRNMTAEDDIKALTYDLSPSDSEAEEQQGGEGEETEEQIEREETKTKEEETKIEQKEAKPAGAEKTEVSLETLEREETAALAALSTPVKPKQKRKR